MIEPAATPPLSTGISGLDELLVGGLTGNRMYLVEGNPGTGKTTLALQFLLEGVARGESCLYVTLSETETELHAVAHSHGWTLDGVEIFQLASTDRAATDEQYTLYHPSEIELGETIQAVLSTVERLKPRRVVFDSLSEMKLLARDPLRYRRQILALKEFFAGRDCTVLLLDDFSSGGGDLQLQSLAHGVILLEQLPFDYGRARRRLRIVKYRGVPAIEGFHDFVIRKGGVTAFPQLVATPSAEGEPGQPIASGLTELDALLGGGLGSGTATVMIGPPGTGKSTLAALYASTSAAPAAVFLFDERRSSYFRRCGQLGLKIREGTESGQLTIEQVEPGDLSPGEFSYRVRDAVEKRGVKLVVIDSLNGYLTAIPQSDSPLIRMYELLSYLASKGVATILIVAQHGVIGTSMNAPIDISYLADTILMLRFFEASGEVRRAISVVKKRTGEHETTIREFRIGTNGIRVGDALTEFHGVLTGVPQYVGARTPLMDKRTDG
jgi:circadian clock protein KaiC